MYSQRQGYRNQLIVHLRVVKADKAKLSQQVSVMVWSTNFQQK